MGARIWIPDQELVWKAAEVVNDFKGKILEIEYEDGQKETLSIESSEKLPPLRNPEILIGENDLTSLSYLHEPAVLYNLQVRFCNNNVIYTYCGIVLVAINPYEELPIYGNDTISAYHGQAMGDLDPHIFAVAEEAYTQMERENQNQSIIVSGESGAGKTVSAKYAMRYFATVGGSATETQIEKKVLASNPIMEAIGNAKTTRNDNSSRFGKYIEIDFNHRYHITGANMRTYLLEKSRVVFQAPEERNYHIFYQLCASADLEELQDLQLDDQTSFHYTNQGDSPSIAGIDDAKNFLETRNALRLLGFSEVQQMSIFRILSAVLHLGNIVIIRGGDFQEDTECSKVCENDPHLLATSELLGISSSQFSMWICNRKIQSMREIITKPMTQDQAVFARDALAKHIYSSLFDWIVKLINKSLESNDKLHRFIGVLDIYGFETFETNSFEQFCINYANEKLQQQFNLHVFKLEQEEYVREKIEWKFIDFYDNQPCIDLIESKLGILDLLDEECKMPKGTDETWCQKLYQQCHKWKHFEKPRLSNSAFIIHHFADNVKYDVNGFLDKNRDNVMEEHIDILRSSEFELVAKLFEEIKIKTKGIAQVHAAKPAPKSSNKQHRKTVGSQFHDSLSLLMATLNATTPHYIRCIKPNDEKAAFMFEPHRAIQQLRACGVLETVRISAAGYPSRWVYLDFLNRYRVLTHSKSIDRTDMRSTCQRILENVIKEEDTFQFGKTKIFFRAGQVAYLEKLRADRLRSCAIMIQKHIRGWQQKNRYEKIHKTVVGLQCYGRGLMARRHARFLRETRAAIVIQKYIRSFLCQQKYCCFRKVAIGIQAHSRGMWARQRFHILRCTVAAVIIQKYIRGWLCRQRYKKMIQQVILLQSCVRRWHAKRELKALKIEAKSVEHMKKLNKGLENKIISLQQKIEEIVKENKAFKLREGEVKNLTGYAEKAKTMEVELKMSKKRIAELEEKLRILNIELEQKSEEKKDLISEKDLLIRNKDEVIKSLNTDNKRLKEDINRMNELIKANEKGADEQLKTRVDSEKRLLLEEFSAERASYQKLLKENARLEQRLENLQNEFLHKGSSHHRTPSDLSLISIRSDTTEIVQDDISDIPDEDIGYGSVRGKDLDLEYVKLDDIRWTQTIPTKEETGEAAIEIIEERKNKLDISLILKLQQKLKNTEAQKANLEKKLERLQSKEEKSLKDQNIIRDVIQMQELEMENSKLREEMSRLRMLLTCNDNSNRTKELLNQFECLQEELERRREECIQLRSILANRSLDLKSVAKDFYGGNLDLINEDGELLMAFETQKKLIWQLESELQDEKSKSNLSETELRHEIQRLREDNERQQRLLSQNLKKSPQAQTEAILQHEINRLTGENVDLREKIDNLSERIKKLKKQLKIYVKQLKENEAGQEIKSLEMSKAKNDCMPVIKHKDVDYTGMFEYKKEDEGQIIRTLITDLKPNIAVTLLPGLSAYVLFMCIRHTDYINDDEKVRSLLNNTIFAIKRVIKKRHEQLEYTILWLANTCRLLHNLKQYSGDKAFQINNTSKQNEQCLKNFDLSEYRQVLSDVAVWIYQAVIKIMEEKVQPLIVPAILEHEGIPGISGKPSGMRGRTSSATRELESYIEPQKAPAMLLEELNVVLKILSIHGVDPELISQVFKQLFYFICAGALNNLLLRKDMCHWSKGMQIRYNLSCLEQWCRDQKIQHNEVTETLAPVIQASQLLQARKTEADVQSICDMCNRLTTSQIVKILNLYTPADEFEERVPISFIRKIQQCLQQKDTSKTQATPSQGTLLMDTKFAFPIRFPFNPSSIQLEDIVIPDCLNLPMLKKV